MIPFRLRFPAWFARPSASRRVRPALILGLAGALAVWGGLNTVFANGVGDSVTQGLNRLKTVAAILDGRSPGERAQGALVNLKQERHFAAQERALPKTRDPGPLAALLSYPSNGPLPAVKGPFYDMLSGEPSLAAPTDLIIQDSPPTALGAPQTDFPIAPPGGIGGGGGMAVPPSETTLTGIPPAPTAVPEPSSWLMMFFGFVAVARLIRRERSPRGNLRRGGL
jgi:hypothetical protein